MQPACPGFLLSDLYGVTGHFIVTAVIHIYIFVSVIRPTKQLLLVPSDRLHVLYHQAKTEELKLVSEFCVVLQQRDALALNEKSKDIPKHTVIKIKLKRLIKRRFCKNEIKSRISSQICYFLASSATVKLSGRALHPLVCVLYVSF
jgi:hypothetical protein